MNMPILHFKSIDYVENPNMTQKYVYIREKYSSPYKPVCKIQLHLNQISKVSMQSNIYLITPKFGT